MVGNKFQAMDCLMFQNQKPLSDSVTRILKCICFKNWTIADHNPRSSWREGTQAEDLMRAAYDMQVGDVGNVGVLPSGKEILVLGDINVGGATCCPSCHSVILSPCHLVILSSCQVVGLGAYHIVSLRILELANLFMDLSLYISWS